MKKQVKVVNKPLTSYFLESDKREALCKLLKSYKDQYLVYKEAAKDTITEDYYKKGLICSNAHLKQVQLKRYIESMWNSLQNEFYETADICWESIWCFQDILSKFDESGYLLPPRPVELSKWSQLLKSWVHKEWAIEVLKLVKDFKLDYQPEDYVTAFQNDFKRVKDKASFCSAVLKWNDMIYWSPWKLSLLDNTCQQPINEHYDCDFNAEYEESEHEFY